MKIILLEHPRIPSSHHFNDIANTPLWSCLMTGYAAASLTEAGHDVEILDATGTSFDDAVEMVLVRSPDILAVHAVYFWENTGKLFDMLSDIRKKGYGGTICLFGFFPTLAWKDLLQEARAVDCIAIGEPEESLVNLARNLGKSGAIEPSPGLATRVAAKPTLPGFRRPFEPLDKLPFPVRCSIEAENTMSVLASRGCYNGCSFCLVPALDGNRACWRARSAENVSAEIQDLLGRRKNDFYFVDPNFVGPGQKGRDRAKELAGSLSGLGITFGLETRANDITGPLLKSLRDAGLTSLLIGLESGNARVLSRLCKRITVAENERAVAAVRDSGIEPEIGFIMFDPSSTIEEIRENLNFLDRNRLLDRLGRTVNVLCHEPILFKGTPGYRIAAERGAMAPEGVFGFEGRVLYQDWRVGWLAGVMKHVCHSILREMEGQDSRIHWLAEKPGRGVFPAVNDHLVAAFRRMLDTATHLTSRPEATWTRAQWTKASDEILHQAR